jgi:hypothetical protein
VLYPLSYEGVTPLGAYRKLFVTPAQREAGAPRTFLTARPFGGISRGKERSASIFQRSSAITLAKTSACGA